MKYLIWIKKNFLEYFPVLAYQSRMPKEKKIDLRWKFLKSGAPLNGMVVFFLILLTLIRATTVVAEKSICATRSLGWSNKQSSANQSPTFLLSGTSRGNCEKRSETSLSTKYKHICGHYIWRSILFQWQDIGHRDFLVTRVLSLAALP